MSSVVVPSSFRPYLPSPNHTTAYPLRHTQDYSSSNSEKLRDHLQLRGTAFFKGGLRTPPAENNMSATYHNPVLSNTYNSHVALARQPAGLVQADRTGGVFCDVVTGFSAAHPTHQSQYQQPYPSQTIVPQQSHPSSRPSTRSTTPASTGNLSAHSEGTVSKKDSTMVTHSLQLPTCISPNGGNLDDFAALVGFDLLFLVVYWLTVS